LLAVDCDKAEVVVYPAREPRDNDRYVLTNLKRASRGVFAEYHGHHDMENRIKEVKLDLRMDKTSCAGFAANQFRVLLSLAAAMLLQAFQARLAAGTEFGGAQMGTLRERLFKRAVRVRESARRIVWQFSRHYPWAGAWNDIAVALGATGG
jgi:hypothetical protein